MAVSARRPAGGLLRCRPGTEASAAAAEACADDDEKEKVDPDQHEAAGCLIRTNGLGHATLDLWGCEAPQHGQRSKVGEQLTVGRLHGAEFLQGLHMLRQGEAMHRVDTHGGYMEIDTLEDASLAEAWWSGADPDRSASPT